MDHVSHLPMEYHNLFSQTLNENQKISVALILAMNRAYHQLWIQPKVACFDLDASLENFRKKNVLGLHVVISCNVFPVF